MNPPEHLSLTLLSGTTFARGSGRAGEVDIEIDHDDLGLPRIRGKRIRSLLRDTWISMKDCFPELDDAGCRVFGPPGDVEETSILRFGTATLEEVYPFVLAAVNRKDHPIDPLEILRSLSSVRTQTSEQRETGAPERASLRAVRVANRGLAFTVGLQWLRFPNEDDLCCLALAVLGTRQAGLARNRGRGFVEMLLQQEKVADASLDRKYTRALAEIPTQEAS
jgi:hypothetical protein